MLVWSGSQCWSDGLLPLLKAHTSVLLTTVRTYFYFVIENKKSQLL